MPLLLTAPDNNDKSPLNFSVPNVVPGPSGTYSTAPDPLQLWGVVYDWTEEAGTPTLPYLRLVNASSGLYATSSANESGAIYQTDFNYPSYPGLQTWYLWPSWNTLNPIAHKNWNLNAAGSSPYTSPTPAIIWAGDQGGDPTPNEQFQFNLVECLEPAPPVIPVPLCALISKVTDSQGYSLALTSPSNTPQTQVNVSRYEAPGTNNQQWYVLPAIMGGTNIGYALINSSSNLAVAYGYPNNGDPVLQHYFSVQSPLSPSFVWMGAASGNQGYNMLGAGYSWGQLINIPGNPPYQPGSGLILWAGDSDNSDWLIQFISFLPET